MKRALGKVPNAGKIHWDWRGQVGWVRFEKGATPDLDAVRKSLGEAIDLRSEFTADSVTFYEKLEDLHDAVR